MLVVRPKIRGVSIRSRLTRIDVCEGVPGRILHEIAPGMRVAVQGSLKRRGSGAPLPQLLEP